MSVPITVAMASESLNVIALISGGKDSFFSLLHCIENGHRIVALANLFPQDEKTPNSLQVIEPQTQPVATGNSVSDEKAESESDLRAGKISINSPIGKGLMGKEKGEIAEIQVPSGKMQFEILDISF